MRVIMLATPSHVIDTHLGIHVAIKLWQFVLEHTLAEPIETAAPVFRIVTMAIDMPYMVNATLL